MEVEELFWAKVDVQGEDDCWEWQGSRTDKNGYGLFSLSSSTMRAHRVAWELWNAEPIPEGMSACHSCDNPPCVNPEHIWLGTSADNNRDRDAKGRHANSQKIVCPAGHPYTDENTYLRANGKRDCRECKRVRDRKREGWRWTRR